MKVIIFGATGMVGQGVLRECLVDPDVESVLSIARRPCGKQDPKLQEILHDDFFDYSAIESRLVGYDACFFCLGVSSVGMDAERYRHLTYDLTMAAATTLAQLNPGMVFTYVTGRGTDSTERGPMMWARVKGKTENDLLKLPFGAAYMFRPAGIQPLHGVEFEPCLGEADLCRDRTAVDAVGSHLAEIDDDHRTGRPRHDQCCARRLSEAGAGKRGYQSVLARPSFRCAILRCATVSGRARTGCGEWLIAP